jgi:hypothetical protein
MKTMDCGEEGKEKIFQDDGISTTTVVKVMTIKLLEAYFVMNGMRKDYTSKTARKNTFWDK